MILFTKIGTTDKVIGNYESEERVATVFQDIHSAYSPDGILSTNISENQVSQLIGLSNVKIMYIAMNEPTNSITTWENYIYYRLEV